MWILEVTFGQAGTGRDSGEIGAPPLTLSQRKREISRESTFSMRFYDSATSNARSANSSPFMGSVDDQPDSLKIRVPTPLGYIVRMADIVAECRTLATNLTSSCHGSLLSNNKKHRTIADSMCLRQTTESRKLKCNSGGDRRAN